MKVNEKLNGAELAIKNTIIKHIDGCIERYGYFDNVNPSKYSSITILVLKNLPMDFGDTYEDHCECITTITKIARSVAKELGSKYSHIIDQGFDMYLANHLEIKRPK